ncbi:hypothetical protein GCM10027570_55740 [Streptomonospora sediminis]
MQRVDKGGARKHRCADNAQPFRQTGQVHGVCHVPDRMYHSHSRPPRPHLPKGVPPAEGYHVPRR